MESDDDIEATYRAQLAPDGGVQCPLSAVSVHLDSLTSNMCRVLADASCPLVTAIQERLRFETLVTELSATFVNVSMYVSPAVRGTIPRGNDDITQQR